MSDVRCPRCDGRSSIGLLGNAITLRFRKLLRRNLYACHHCALVWRTPHWDGSLPIVAPSRVSLRRSTGVR